MTHEPLKRVRSLLLALLAVVLLSACARLRIKNVIPRLCLVKAQPELGNPQVYLEIQRLQPLLVRPLSGQDADFELVAGERRWRAAQRVGLHEVPVIIRPMADSEALEQTHPGGRQISTARSLVRHGHGVMPWGLTHSSSPVMERVQDIQLQ